MHRRIPRPAVTVLFASAGVIVLAAMLVMTLASCAPGSSPAAPAAALPEVDAEPTASQSESIAASVPDVRLSSSPPRFDPASRILTVVVGIDCACSALRSGVTRSLALEIEGFGDLEPSQFRYPAAPIAQTVVYVEFAIPGAVPFDPDRAALRLGSPGARQWTVPLWSLADQRTPWDRSAP